MRYSIKIYFTFSLESETASILFFDALFQQKPELLEKYFVKFHINLMIMLLVTTKTNSLMLLKR